jgi:small subunit ribosomal protein S20
MANKKSAEKRNRQDIQRRARNRTHRTRLRNAVRHLRQIVASGDAKVAQEILPSTLSIIDTTAQKGIIHGNAASRTKSRLTQAVNALSA